MSEVPLNDIPESSVPAVLYKYLPPDRIDILENTEIRFSRPSEFNDTFDTHYLVPTSQGSKGSVARMKLKYRLGIFCLTEEPHDQLMWVHYARNHTGFVLGFNARAPYFNEDSRVLRKIAYQSHPKVFPEADINACFYKSDQWVHEREWRCVRLFDSSESRMVEFDPSLITHIVLGFQMEQWQIARIVHAVELLNMSDTKFLVSSPSLKSWTFENHPKRMSVCDKCHGDGYLMENS